MKRLSSDPDEKRFIPDSRPVQAPFTSLDARRKPVPDCYREENRMEYLIGWALLLGIGLLLWLVVRFAGGERGEPQATCGLNGCGTPERTRRRG